MSEKDGAILVEEDGGIVTVRVARGAKLNALTPHMIDELGAVALALDARNDVRCVILTGEGEKAFCVGADINAWSTLSPLDMWRLWVRRGHRVFDLWARLRPPVIAAINGHALGGGLELAAVADIRITSRGATFGLPEATISTCPGWSGTQRLVKLIGSSRVKYLALSGQRLNADTALQLGVVHEVVDARAGAVAARARELAAHIATLAPVSLQLTKQLIDAADGEGAALALEAMASAVAAGTADAAEGVASFREKRPAHYSGE
jgi:enoyl-CoA hydratase/carnithine racemase